MYNRKHFPGLVRPARPARCCADAFDMGDTRSDSSRVLGLKTFCLLKPGSITNTTPSIVRDVSAMLVDMITFLPILPFLSGGLGPKIRCCCAGGNVEYRGIQSSSPRSFLFFASVSTSLQAFSISWEKI